jgi:hypothetical protein
VRDRGSSVSGRPPGIAQRRRSLAMSSSRPFLLHATVARCFMVGSWEISTAEHGPCRDRATLDESAPGVCLPGRSAAPLSVHRRTRYRHRYPAVGARDGATGLATVWRVVRELPCRCGCVGRHLESRPRVNARRPRQQHALVREPLLHVHRQTPDEIPSRARLPRRGHHPAACKYGRSRRCLHRPG